LSSAWTSVSRRQNSGGNSDTPFHVTVSY
jgi:hypothetical protein